MDVAVPLWLLLTLLTSISWGVGYACGRLKRASRSTPPTKPKDSPETTPISELSKLQAEQAALYSALESVTTTVKRLSARHGMREKRERDREGSNEAPPIGASKTELLRHYGVAGLTGPGFAKKQMEIELETKGRTN